MLLLLLALHIDNPACKPSTPALKTLPGTHAVCASIPPSSRPTSRRWPRLRRACTLPGSAMSSSRSCAREVSKGTINQQQKAGGACVTCTVVNLLSEAWLSPSRQKHGCQPGTAESTVVNTVLVKARLSPRYCQSTVVSPVLFIAWLPDATYCRQNGRPPHPPGCTSAGPRPRAAAPRRATRRAGVAR